LNIYNFIFVDLKAFERRLTDVVSQVQPVAVRWRGIVNLSRVCTHNLYRGYVQSCMYSIGWVESETSNRWCNYSVAGRVI